VAFTLNDVIPWGRNLDEYCAMFALGDAERRVSILGCGDGPSSFNAEGTAQGMRIVSVDPLYAFRTEEIRARIEEATPTTERFLTDYDEGLNQGRYVTGSVSDLPFPDGSYDLALCSHFLFLYSEQHNLAFHLKAILELTRVAEEVRIFPLLELGGTESRHVAAAKMALQRSGLKVEKVRVDYEFQRGGNEMLKISR
jgi:ubiquinone/menaquinone biosynthesis C-methylase UbiE